MYKYPPPVYVLGRSGMLGNTALSFFRTEGYKVDVIMPRFSADAPFRITDDLNAREAGVIINAAGAIPQRDPSPTELALTNALLPLHLAVHLDRKHFLVHPSSDCVFDGRSGSAYEPEAAHDARNHYGWTKSLGERAILERPNTLVIRTSIIGGQGDSRKGLLSWLLTRPDGTSVPGFTNHWWNGITSLEWCRIVDEWLQSRPNSRPVFIQATSGVGVSKYELLTSAVRAYGRRISIEPTVDSQTIDRRLVATMLRPGIGDQLRDLAEFEKAV